MDSAEKAAPVLATVAGAGRGNRRRPVQSARAGGVRGRCAGDADGCAADLRQAAHRCLSSNGRRPAAMPRRSANCRRAARSSPRFCVGKDSPTDVERDDVRQYPQPGRPQQISGAAKEGRVVTRPTSPLAPPRAMVVADSRQAERAARPHPRQSGPAGQPGAAAVPARRWRAKSGSRSRTAAAGWNWPRRSPRRTIR